MAIVNLSAGIVVATWPERASDLESVAGFVRGWLVDGLDVYGPDEQGIALYPPYAIVTLSPLGLVSAPWAVRGWAALNLVLAAWAPYLAVRAVRPKFTPRESALPIVMFLCWGGFRTLLQFSLLSLTLGLLAMVLAEKRPSWSGICLGLALFKPPIAAPFLFWALFSRRLRVVGIAMALVIAEFAVFCLRAQAGPVAIVLRYRDNLRLYYLGDALVNGLSHVRPVIVRAVSNTASADQLAIEIALLLFGAICVMGFAEGTRREALMYSAPPLVGLWSLLTFYHLTYGFLLLLPTAVLLIFSNDEQTLRLRTILFWFLQFSLMVDVPAVWRRTRHVFPDSLFIDAVAPDFDRILMLVLFAGVTCLYLRVSGCPPFRSEPTARL